MPKPPKTQKPVLIVAEKPSVARDIAKVVGASPAAQGFLQGNGYVVTWALGHLVTLAQPHEVKPEWKSWRKDTLPMIPETWPLTVLDKTKVQFKIVKKLLASCKEVICATDAGREGELIFRYIYEAARCKKPVKRLWISSLTRDAISAGLQNLQASARYDGLADAARGRSCADWLIGMNLSRAYALTSGMPLFVGRVQTPTLAMVVKREHEIRNFKPEDYFEILAKFTAGEIYEGYYIGEERGELERNPYQAKRLPPDAALAQKIVDRVKSGAAQVKSVDSKSVKQPPPLLYDLTELQRHANRIYGYSASNTLELAQALYEKHKLISYPRTDSKHLSQSVANTLSQVVSAIRKPYEKDLSERTGKKPLGPRFVNDAAVSDHHAIIPTDISSDRAHLTEGERKIYDLICRRLLSAWQDDYVTSVTTAITRVTSSPQGTEPESQDIFRSQGIIVDQLGWKKLEVGGMLKENSEDKLLPSNLKNGLRVLVIDAQANLKKTKAPPHLTEATLLTAMETAGRTLDDKELAAVIRETGLGTPATRAGIIETLLARKYMERRGKSLIATDLGITLIETVHSSVKSPELTAKWEKELVQIQNFKRSLKDFMSALESELRETVRQALGSPLASSLAPTPPQKSFQVQIQPEKEKNISEHILKILSAQGAHAAGRIFEKISQTEQGIERREFEYVLHTLKVSGTIRISHETFEKKGESISYRKVALGSKPLTSE